MGLFSNNKIKTIKYLSYIGIISLVVYQLIIRAIYSLPGDFLFFITSDAVENTINVFIAIVLFHYVFKLKSNWKKVMLIGLFTLILIVLASLKDFRIHHETTYSDSYNYFTSFLGKTLLYYLLFYFINSLDIFNQYKKLERDLNEAKEQLLRSQLNPHFLFNAFNSLYSLSLKNHPKTSEYILKLSSMMRYLTDDTIYHKVVLSREVDFIQKYISIEKIRFGEDAAIDLLVNGDNIDKKLIEPFLLITLVENAFKHGFYTNAKAAYINILLTLENNKLLFSVENKVFDKQHFQETNRKGKGLENLTNRLQLLYPKNSNLEITQSNNTYKAQLTITLS